jgi:D-arabinose 1-dehydrogenase-like Zn-dependent alcohol dehydrogenase
MIGGIRETQETIDFCAEHEIGAMVEIISTLADGRGQVGSVLGA